MKRKIGASDLVVNSIGLGCMGLTAFYGKPVEEREGISLIHEAIERGVNHFDTAEMYGPHTNEELLGKALQGRRSEVVLATKFGIVSPAHTGSKGALDGSPENCRRAVEGSLSRLRTDYIDLYYLHRLDPDTPIEDTVGAMAKLVEEGKVRAIGLSEVSSDTLRRAVKVHPIAAVQSEYSIFTREIEDTLFPTLEETGTSLVAYSPLGRGMLAGAYQDGKRPASDDWRSMSLPRFEGENFEANRMLAAEVVALAERKGVSASQLALAWVLARSKNIVTIPGTTKLANLKANLGAYNINLTEDDLRDLAPIADKVVGTRYSDFGMKLVDA